MRSFVLCSTIAILLTGQPRCQEAGPTSPVQLRLIEGMAALSTRPPAESGSCIVVTSEGKVYIEKRTHLIMESKADVKVYSGQLSTDQIATLRTLLADEELKGIANAQPEKMPQHETDFSWISAELTIAAQSWQPKMSIGGPVSIELKIQNQSDTGLTVDLGEDEKSKGFLP